MFFSSLVRRQVNLIILGAIQRRRPTDNDDVDDNNNKIKCFNDVKIISLPFTGKIRRVIGNSRIKSWRCRNFIPNSYSLVKNSRRSRLEGAFILRIRPISSPYLLLPSLSLASLSYGYAIGAYLSHLDAHVFAQIFFILLLAPCMFVFSLLLLSEQALRAIHLNFHLFQAHLEVRKYVSFQRYGFHYFHILWL